MGISGVYAGYLLEIFVGYTVCWIFGMDRSSPKPLRLYTYVLRMQSFIHETCVNNSVIHLSYIYTHKITYPDAMVQGLTHYGGSVLRDWSPRKRKLIANK